MKVIDLLNKIANGEGVPKTIKLCGNKYQYNEHFKDYPNIILTSKETKIGIKKLLRNLLSSN